MRYLRYNVTQTKSENRNRMIQRLKTVCGHNDVSTAAFVRHPQKQNEEHVQNNSKTIVKLTL